MTIPTSQASPGTYNFDPSAGNLVLYAYRMINIPRTELTQAHLWDGSMAINFTSVDMSNRNPLRFALQTLSTGAGNSFATSAASASGTTLTFASSPGSIIGFYATDTTVTTAIPANTTVTSVSGSGPYTVTLSAAVNGVNLGDSITFSELAPITQATSVYNLPNHTLAVSIVTIATGSGQSTVERVLGPISAYEYAAMPNKLDQAPPTSYFFSLTAIPTITFWPTPDSGGPYTMNIQTFRQLQDVDLTNAQGVDSPYRFLDALTTGTAARLADLYQPARAADLYAKYEQRISLAQSRDQETVGLSILPGLGSYYRIN